MPDTQAGSLRHRPSRPLRTVASDTIRQLPAAVHKVRHPGVVLTLNLVEMHVKVLELGGDMQCAYAMEDIAVTLAMIGAFLY